MRHIVILAALVLLPGLAAAEEEWVVKETDKSVAEAVDDLSAAIEKAGAKVMATVDHAANAASADLELAPTTLVIFGNPKVGTPLMQENRRVAIDLPQKILVWEEDGRTLVGYVAAEAVAARHGISAEAESVGKMVGALDKLSDAAVAQ